jgi:hypothetical protein
MAFILWNTLGGGPIFFSGWTSDSVRCLNVFALDRAAGLTMAEDSATAVVTEVVVGPPSPRPSFLLFERSIGG